MTRRMSDDAEKTAKHAAVPIDDPAPATIKTDAYLDEHSAPMPSTERSALEPAPDHRDRATLTVLTGVDAGQTFALEGQTSVLGRAPTADVRFDDGAVSRQH